MQASKHTSVIDKDHLDTFIRDGGSCQATNLSPQTLDHGRVGKVVGKRKHALFTRDGLMMRSLPREHYIFRRDLLAVYWRFGETESAPKGLTAYPKGIERDNWGLDGGGEPSIMGWKRRFLPMRA